MSGWDRALGAAFVVVTVSLVAAAFLPGDAAEWGSAGVLVVVRIGWLALVVGRAATVTDALCDGHFTA